MILLQMLLTVFVVFTKSQIYTSLEIVPLLKLFGEG